MFFLGLLNENLLSNCPARIASAVLISVRHVTCPVRRYPNTFNRMVNC
jgi:hypothetical protein